MRLVEKKTLTSFPAVFYSPPHLSQVFLNERLATLFSCTAAAPHSFIVSAKVHFFPHRSFLCEAHTCCCSRIPSARTQPKLLQQHYTDRKVALARVHSKITRATRILLPGEYNVHAVTGACLALARFWAAAAVYIV